MHRFATRLLVLVLLVSLMPDGSWAQDPGDADLSKLSPSLRTVLEADEAAAGKKASRQLEVQALPQRAEDGSRLYGVAVRTTRPEALRKAGISVTSTYDDFALARVTAEDLRTLARTSEATSVRELGVARSHNDVAAGVSGVRLLNNGRLNETTYKGSGVIVCVIDSGIDYTHEDFRGLSNTSNSRILYIWDQTLSKESGEQNPKDRGDSDLSGFDYGVEYTKTDIENDLAGQDIVRQEDTDGHGTHVTGTAAGNGGAHPDEKYKGMAPKADIITVKAGNGTYPFSNVIDGMNYCGEVAEDQGKPVVVNMSLGASFGPHDGTTNQDVAVDNFTSTSGRAVTISAGNEGNSGMHTSNTISASNSASFDINVPSSVSSGGYEADTWISNSNDATIEITTPDGTTVGPLTPSDSDGRLEQSTSDGRVVLENYLPSSLGGGDRRLELLVDGGPAQGDWTVTITNTSSGSFTHHAWLHDDFLSGSTYANLVGGDSNYTIGTPGSSKDAITVGAFNHRWRWCDNSSPQDCWLVSNSFDDSDDIASFSSIGPLRKGTQKPEITAPGQRMGSSYSDDMGSLPDRKVLPGGKHRILQGTSMSAPATAGAIALLLQEDPNLTQSDIKTALQSTARTDTYTGGSLPNPTWGYGKLDALRAMSYVINSSTANRRSIIAHDEWGSGASRNTSGDERIAVQFTPSNDGVASGVLLHPSSTVNLSGPLNVEIWSDNGGEPGSKLGSTVNWDHNRVFAYTWNYLDLTGTGVDVQQNTTYHVVLSFTQSGDNMYVRYDDGTVDGKSSVYSNGWSSFSIGDFRLRPVVSYSGVSPQLPVELANFEGQADGNAVVLSWATSSETNNAGFAVEHQQDDGTFRKLGFKEGAGTTSESQSYRYRTSELEIGTHTFRLKQKDLDGSTSYSEEITVDLILSGKYKLTDVHPNPVREAGTVSLTVKSAQKVQAEVYNVLGQRVATLHDGPIKAETPTTMSVGSSLSSGVYFLRVDGESFSTTEKFVRVR